MQPPLAPDGAGETSRRAADPSSANAPAEGSVEIDIVLCDGVDGESIASAAMSLGHRVKAFDSPQAWAARADSDSGADVTAIVATGERLANQPWVPEAVASADTLVLAVAIDATLEHASLCVNRGAEAFISLPASGDRVKRHLGALTQRALRSRARRRAAAQHRRALSTLTDGERDVLDRMLAGLANKQIAQRLSIGLRTVELRRSKILRKMGATSLAQLISHVCQANADLCAGATGGDALSG